MKGTKFKRNFEKLIYPLAIIVFYALGAFTCSVRFNPDVLGGNYFFGVGDISLVGFCKGWMYNLIPFLVIFLSGYDYLGKWYTLIVLGIRAYLSGFSGCACVSDGIYERGFTGVLIFALFTLFESLILIVLLSGAVEQEKFRRYYNAKLKTPFKSGVNKFYIGHNFQRCGIMILLYIFRSGVCYIM